MSQPIPFKIVRETGPGWESYRWRAGFPDGSVFVSRSFRDKDACERNARGWCNPPGRTFAQNVELSRKLAGGER